MPLTCLFCIVGAASISALPMFNGFVSKSMIISAAAYSHLAVIWLMLQFASAVIVPYVKVPYFAFFGRDSGIRAKEPPINMLIAMGIAATLCVLLGIFPGPLYNILPYPVAYEPYTVVHVVEKLQLILFGLLAFCLLMLSGYYPAEMRAINLDVDWFYRKGGRALYRLMDRGLNRLNSVSDDLLARKLPERLAYLAREGPARLVAVFASPFKAMGGAGEAEMKDFKRKIHASFETLSMPIGLGAAAAALFLVLLVWIN
jgi:multicomponent Na+:H+ antiporter subunit D